MSRRISTPRTQGRRTGIADPQDRGEIRDRRIGSNQNSGTVCVSVDKSGLIPDSTVNNAPKTASSVLRVSVNAPHIDNHHRAVTYLG